MSIVDARHPVHLALGDSAAGCLRAAGRDHGLVGTVISISDDLSHGPLDDGFSRAAYLRACLGADGEWGLELDDAFEPWRDLMAELDLGTFDVVVIWGGENVAEVTFLAMACWWLAERDLTVARMSVSRGDGHHYVAVHTPAQLAARSASARRLTSEERVTLASEFERLRDETGSLRRWEVGRIQGIPTDSYDQLLLASAGTDWMQAGRVVGAAMGRCDPHNLMSDLFFASRLQVLVEAGAVEAKGGRDVLLDRAVRLTGPGRHGPSVMTDIGLGGE